ncbi:MAG: serine hydroxymethyltransferase [Tissierellia bacterium]|nr:serine hydroxymethyltransferase [Tissierellia bacterium]
MFRSLQEVDPEMDELIRKEEERQRETLDLIASENYAPIAVLQANSSVVCNKYSEGYIGRRYYGGNKYIDEIEGLCKKRALKLYGLDEKIWDVNVQPLSGSTANLAVYMGIVGKNGRIMGMDLSSGGHLSHGYRIKRRKITASSMFFRSKSYKIDEEGKIDYGDIERKYKKHRPDLVICGASAYSLDIEYKRIREIIGEDTYMMADISHVSGLIASGLLKNPFEVVDIVTTTTHKILRGPRAAMIFYRRSKMVKKERVDMKSKIDSGVFPGLNGGPHNQKIAALGVALKLANSVDYKSYGEEVIRNAKILADYLEEKGCKIVGGRTENHLILFTYPGIRGAELEKVCDLANISINKNCIKSDKSPMNPTGIRIGTPAITTRGLNREDVLYVGELLMRAIKITLNLKERALGKDIDYLMTNDLEINKLKKDVVDFIYKFPIPCFNFRF